MATDPEGTQNGRFNGMETIDKEIFQHVVLNTEEEAMIVREGSGERGRVRSLFKVARQVLLEDPGENHADPQGVYVPESGKRREVPHRRPFSSGRTHMEFHAQGDEGPELA